LVSREGLEFFPAQKMPIYLILTKRVPYKILITESNLPKDRIRTQLEFNCEMKLKRKYQHLNLIRLGQKNTQAKAWLAPYLLQLRSMFGPGQARPGQSLDETFFLSVKIIKVPLNLKKVSNIDR